MQRSREPEMNIIIWPWAGWILGFISLVSACFLVGFCKEAKLLTKTAVIVIVLLFVIAGSFILFSPIESFEGIKSEKLFYIKRISVCGYKCVKLKWSQVKAVEVCMAGESNSFNNSIFYRIEFETVTGSKLRCLESSDRKKSKERLILIRMYMNRDTGVGEMHVENKTVNMQNMLDKQREIRMSNM